MGNVRGTGTGSTYGESCAGTAEVSSRHSSNIQPTSLGGAVALARAAIPHGCDRIETQATIGRYPIAPASNQGPTTVKSNSTQSASAVERFKDTGDFLFINGANVRVNELGCISATIALSTAEANGPAIKNSFRGSTPHGTFHQPGLDVAVANRSAKVNYDCSKVIMWESKAGNQDLYHISAASNVESITITIPGRDSITLSREQILKAKEESVTREAAKREAEVEAAEEGADVTPANQLPDPTPQRPANSPSNQVVSVLWSTARVAAQRLLESAKPQRSEVSEAETTDENVGTSPSDYTARAESKVATQPLDEVNAWRANDQQILNAMGYKEFDGTLQREFPAAELEENQLKRTRALNLSEKKATDTIVFKSAPDTEVSYLLNDELVITRILDRRSTGQALSKDAKELARLTAVTSSITANYPTVYNFEQPLSDLLQKHRTLSQRGALVAAMGPEKLGLNLHESARFGVKVFDMIAAPLGKDQLSLLKTSVENLREQHLQSATSRNQDSINRAYQHIDSLGSDAKPLVRAYWTMILNDITNTPDWWDTPPTFDKLREKLVPPSNQ